MKTRVTRSLEKRSASRQMDTNRFATVSPGRASLLRATRQMVCTRAVWIAVSVIALLPFGAPQASEIIPASPEITILCCDFSEDVPVLSDADSIAAVAGAVILATRVPIAVKVAVASARAGANKTPPVPPTVTSPQAVFLSKLRALIDERSPGAWKLIHPAGFDGYEGRYNATETIQDTPWVLEIRFSAVVKQIYGPYMPSAGAYFRLVRTKDQQTVTSGFVATVNTTRGEPNFFTRPYLVPMLPALGSHRTGKEMILLPAPIESLIDNFNPSSPEDAEKARKYLDEMAEKVARGVFDQVVVFSASSK